MLWAQPWSPCISKTIQNRIKHAEEAQISSGTPTLGYGGLVGQLKPEQIEDGSSWQRSPPCYQSLTDIGKLRSGHSASTVNFKSDRPKWVTSFSGLKTAPDSKEASAIVRDRVRTLVYFLTDGYSATYRTNAVARSLILRIFPVQNILGLF